MTPSWESAAWAAFNADQERIANELDAERRRRAAIFERVDTSGLDIRDHVDELGVCQSIAYTGLRHWRLGGIDAIPVPPPRWRVRRPARSPAQVARDLMNDRFANPDNQALFKQRSHLVETYFGNTKQNRGITRFARRGLAAVNAEWQLIATVNNIDKLHRATN